MVGVCLAVAALVLLTSGCSALSGATRPRSSGEAYANLLREAAHWQPLRVSDGGIGKPAPEEYREVQLTDAEHGWLLADTSPKVVSLGKMGSGVTYTRSTLLRTTDGGASWQSVYTTAAPALSFSSVSNEAGWLAFESVGGYSVVARTLDGGRTWTLGSPQSEGPEQICAVSANEAWGITRGGTYPIHTVDGGASWAEVKLPPGADRGEYKQVFFLDRQHGWIVGERHRRGADSALFALVLGTQDGGKTFQVAQTPAVQFQASSSDRIHFVNPDEGWIAFEGCVLHTLDGGATWSAVEPAATDSMGSIVDCFFDTHLDGWAVGRRAVTPLALHTLDGGKTWVREQTGAEGMEFGTFNRVAFSDTKHGWLIGEGGTPSPFGKPNAGHMVQFVLKYVP
jgi:photosystem II stability/assembly factor-like uncharacterized protein